MITDRWAFYPIVSGEKATRRDSGIWGRPHYLANVVLAGIVKQDLSSGRATYCKIPIDSRSPYDRGDVFCFGNNTVYFKIRQMGENVLCKWGESAEASRSNWHPSKKEMPISVRHLTPVPIHQSDLPEQRDVLCLQKSKDGSIAIWYDEDGFQIGEFRNGDWVWLVGFDSIRRECDSKKGEPLKLLVSTTVAEISCVPIGVYSEVKKELRIVVVGDGLCKCVYCKTTDAPKALSFSSTTGSLLMDFDDDLELLKVEDGSVETVKNRSLNILLGLTSAGVVSSDLAHHSLVTQSFASLVSFDAALASVPHPVLEGSSAGTPQARD